MADEKQAEQKTEDKKPESISETDDSVVVDLGTRAEVDDKPEVEDNPEQQKEEAAKEEETEQPEKETKRETTGKQYDFESLLEQAKEDLRKELKPSKDSTTYTEEQLGSAEDEADKQLDDGQITQAQHRKYMRQVQQIRDRQNKDRFKSEWENERRRGDAERNVLGWAKENAPQFLDRRSKESREAEDFGVNVLGGQRQGDGWVFSDKVTQVMLGLLHRATTGKDAEKQKEVEKAAFERGVKAKETRRNDLKGNEPPVSSSKTKHDEPVNDKEKEVMERLGIKNLGLYRKFKNLSPKRGSTIEVQS